MSRIAAAALLAAFAAQSPSTISVESRLVSVDVIVRDARGNSVAGLKQDDFAISEDGKAQKIVSFEEHHATQNRAGVASAPLTPGTVTNVSAAADSDLNMLLFDLADTPVLDQAYAKKQMIAFLQNLPAGHQLALFVLSDRLYALQGFTGDSGTLASAAKLINTREMHLTVSESQRATETEDLALFRQGLGERPPGDFLANAVREAVDGKEINDLRVRIGLVADAFRAIAGSVSGYKGRKNLLWLSENFPVGLADHMQILRSGGVGSGGLPQFEGARDVSSGSTRILMDSQIAVYPINVVGVETDSAGAELSGLGSAVAPSTTDPVSNDRLANSFERRQFVRESMNLIADATGGRAIYGTNNLSGALERIVEETATRYTLAYQPTNHRFDGGLRQIRIATRGKSLSLTYRRNYLATASPSAATVQPLSLVAAMRPGLPPATGIRLTATPELPEAGSSTVGVTCAIDAHDLSLTLDDAGRRHGKVEVLLAARPRSGSTQGRQPQVTAMLDLNLDPEQYQAMTTDGVRFRQHLDVPSGTWSLHLGVIDLSTGQIGTVSMPLTLP